MRALALLLLLICGEASAQSYLVPLPVRVADSLSELQATPSTVGPLVYGTWTGSPVLFASNPAACAAPDGVTQIASADGKCWVKVTIGSGSGLASQAANTALANATASPAIPSAVPLPSCPDANGHLNYTSGVGFSCGTSGAPLASQAANTALANATASPAVPTAAPLPSCPDAAGHLNYTSGVGFTCGTSSSSWVLVQTYGAVGDGTTSDTAAVNSAETACSNAGGGIIYFPPTGHAYRFATAPNVVPNGCQIRGAGGLNVPGLYDNTEAHWTNSGTWFRCEDATTSCIRLAGMGSSIDGVNFWYTQPTPSSTTCGAPPCTYAAGWAPTTYPYTITVPDTSVGNWIQNIAIINGYDCLDLEGTGNGISMMRSHVDHVIINCFDRDILMKSVDNTLSLFDIREDPIWFQGSLQVLNYIEGTAGHGIGWDVNYVANLQASHVEFFERRIAILLTDGTAQNGFGSLAFAGANWQVNGMSFNEVCQAMAVASATTHFAGGTAGNGIGWNVFHNILAAADTGTSKVSPQQCAAGKALFDFGSDNVGVHIDDLNVAYADTIAKIGAGTSGYLSAENVRAQKYSAFTTDQPAFIAGANAYPDVRGDFLSIIPNTAAGPLLSGVPIGFASTLGEEQVGANAAQTATISLGTLPASPSVAGMNRRWAFRKDASTESGSNVGSDLVLDAYTDAGTYNFSPVICKRSNGGCAFGGNISMNGTIGGSAPTIASGFGTGAAISGGDNAGRVVVGTAPSGTPTINFGVAFAAAPACMANNETTQAAMATNASTAQLQFFGTIAAGNKVSFLCIGTQ